MSHPQVLLLETMKKAASILQQAGIPFALAGGAAAYARGGAPPVHDVDFVILAEDSDAAAVVFADAGMTVERPPEGWLIKAFDEGRMVDLIYVLAGQPVNCQLLDRAERINVAAVEMPVLGATDIVLSMLRSMSEHHADFALTLTCVRPMREQVDWSEVREALNGSAFARAFLVLLEELDVIQGPASVGSASPVGPASAGSASAELENLAGRLEQALATDPRTHELGIRVEVAGGIASLRGEVAGEQRRALVAAVAAEVLTEEAPEIALRNEVMLTEVRTP